MFTGSPVILRRFDLNSKHGVCSRCIPTVCQWPGVCLLGETQLRREMYTAEPESDSELSASTILVVRDILAYQLVSTSLLHSAKSHISDLWTRSGTISGYSICGEEPPSEELSTIFMQSRTRYYYDTP